MYYGVHRDGWILASNNNDNLWRRQRRNPTRVQQQAKLPFDISWRAQIHQSHFTERPPRPIGCSRLVVQQSEALHYEICEACLHRRRPSPSSNPCRIHRWPCISASLFVLLLPLPMVFRVPAFRLVSDSATSHRGKRTKQLFTYYDPQTVISKPRACFHHGETLVFPVPVPLVAVALHRSAHASTVLAPSRRHGQSCLTRN